MQRTTLGICAAALLLGALAVWSFAPDQSPIWGALLRVGIVLGVVWLAVPNLTLLLAKIPPWLVAATFVGICVVAWRPTTIFVAGPILIALWVFGPRWFARKNK